MTLNAFQLSAPADWQAFERFTRDLFAAKWKDRNAQLNGRAGQAQAGVDVSEQILSRVSSRVPNARARMAGMGRASPWMNSAMK